MADVGADVALTARTESDLDAVADRLPGVDVRRAVAEELRGSPLIVKVAATRMEFGGSRVDWVKQSILHFLPAETLDGYRVGLEANIELPEEILTALDDVSAPAMGYPESGWAQRR